MMRKILSCFILIISTLFFISITSFRGVAGEKPVENAQKKARWKWLRQDTLFANQKLTTSDYALLANENWGISVGGFICTDLFWDNRQMVNARDGGILLYPTTSLPDVNDRDINATPSFNFLAMNSRISLRISAPSVWGANISGFIEGWFMGVSNTGLNGFALRHSYIKMNWGKTALLVGQTWHPMFTENCFASTLAASTGAPFQPFLRAPQIRFTQGFGKTLRLIAYANTQLDQPSTGPEGASSQYLRHSSIPEMGLQFHFEKLKSYDEKKASGYFLIGIGADYKRLIPRLVTGENKYTKKGVDCGAAILFIHYKYSIEASETKKKRSLGVKAKGFYGGGCNEMLMAGGYAVKKYNDGELNYGDNFGYAALNILSGWLDLYMELGNWEFGIFNGYCKNLGAYQKIQDPNNLLSYWGRGIDVNQLYRASVRAKYNIGKLQMGFEPEYTLASYGNQFNDYGKIMKNNTNIVHGLRLLFSATLFF